MIRSLLFFACLLSSTPLWISIVHAEDSTKPSPIDTEKKESKQKSDILKRLAEFAKLSKNLRENGSITLDNSVDESTEETEIISNEENPDAEELAKIQVEQITNEAGIVSPSLTIKDPTLLTRALIFGFKGSVHRLLQKTVDRLFIEGDPNYSLKVTANPLPNAFIYPEKKEIGIDMGLFSLTSNVDELGYVIAHEMTHGNPKQFKILKTDSKVESAIAIASAEMGIDDGQREELRADIGAVQRLIQAGLNPWAAYTLLLKLAKIEAFMKKDFFSSQFLNQNVEYFKTHPHTSIRMIAIKAYLLSLNGKVDLVDNINKVESFSKSFQLFRIRMKTFTFPFLSSSFFLKSSIAFTAFQMAKLILIESSFWNTTLGVKILAISDQSKDTLANYVDAVLRPIVNHLPEFIKDGSLGHFGSNFFQYGIIGTSAVVLGSVSATHLIRHLSKKRTVQLQSVLFSEISTELQLLEKKLRADGKFDPLTVGFLLDGMISSIRETQFLLRKTFKNNYNKKITKNLLELEKSIYSIVDHFTDNLSDAEQKIFFDVIEKSLLDGISFDLLNDPEGQRLAIRLAEKIKPSIMKQDFSEENLVPDSDYKTQFELSKEESIFSTAVHLFTMTPEQFATLTPLKKIFILYRMSQFESISGKSRKGEYFLKHYDEIVDYAFSPSAAQTISNTYLKRILITLQFQPNQILYRNIWDKKILEFRTRLLKSGSGIMDAIGAIDLSKAVPQNSLTILYNLIIGNSAPAQRLLLNRWDQDKLKQYIETNSHSIQEMTELVEKNFSTSNANLISFSKMFFEILITHPEWIKSPQDLENLYEKKWLWPRLNVFYSDSRIESVLTSVLIRLYSKNREIWSYMPGSSEQLHFLFLSKLKEFGKMPKTVDEKLALFTKLTDRGVSTQTDSLFEEIYNELPEVQRDEQAIKLFADGRIWDPIFQNKIAAKTFKESKDYQDLIQDYSNFSIPLETRHKLLNKALDKCRLLFPEGGMTYTDLIEELSNKLTTTKHVAAYLEELKNIHNTGEATQDAATRLLTQILTEVTQWSKSDQWDMILFLRGDIQPSKKIIEEFEKVGHQRIFRLFNTLPLAARAFTIDAFLSDPSGLLPKVKVGSGYARVIIDHLFRNTEPDIREVAEEVLEGFLHSVKAVGNEPLQSALLSYLLAHSGSENQNVGKILRDVFEYSGLTGTKIGQFVKAARLLPKKESEALQDLEDRSRKPVRSDTFKDIDSLKNPELKNLLIYDLLGSASLKFAYAVGNIKTKKIQVLKILRSESLVDVRREFLQLDAMAEYLIGKNQRRYGVLKRLIKSAQVAVQREISFENEVANNAIFRKNLYPESLSTIEGALKNAQSSVIEIKITTPEDRFLEQRAILSDFADGTSFSRMNEGLKPIVAKKILELEHKNFWTDADVIYFDPDRHPGNYLVDAYVLENSKTIHITISPIDSGQLRKITRHQRDQIVDLFSLAQILAQTGSTKWLTDQIGKTLHLDEKRNAAINSKLGLYFPAKDAIAITAYYSLLSAIEDAGITIEPSFYDFARGLVQMNPYEKSAAEVYTDFESPQKQMEKNVKARVETFTEALKTNLTLFEKIKFIISPPDESKTHKESTLGEKAASKNDPDLDKKDPPTSTNNKCEKSLLPPGA